MVIYRAATHPYNDVAGISSPSVSSKLLYTTHKMVPNLALSQHLEQARGYREAATVHKHYLTPIKVR
jgi:hypothetical protein